MCCQIFNPAVSTYLEQNERASFVGKSTTLWFQLEDMFQLIGIEHVMVQLKDMSQGFKKYRFKYKA